MFDTITIDDKQIKISCNCRHKYLLSPVCQYSASIYLRKILEDSFLHVLLRDR